MPLKSLFNTSEPYLGAANDRLAVGEETLDRRAVNQNAVSLSASGAVRLTYFTARKSEPITQIRVRSGTIAAAATPTLIRLGVFAESATGDLTLVASTASDTTLFAATNTTYTKTFTAGWRKQQGSRYALGVIVVSAAALPTFYGIAGAAGPGIGLDSSELAFAPRLTGNLASQADLPSTISAGSIAVSGTGMIYAALLP